MKARGLDPALITCLKQYNGQPIDLLLGNNVIGHLVRHSTRFVMPSGRIIEQTPLGIITYPTLIPNEITTDNNVFHLETSTYHHEEPILTVDSIDNGSPDDENFVIPCEPRSKKNQSVSNAMLDKQMAQMWNLEVLGILPPEALQEKALLDNDLIEQFKKTAITDDDNK
uniref:Uncharacterized protein n=1 Tax=Caenorhabditis japonica TaxID=281687 RepID=A0A8R1IV94_CAEJA